MSSPCSAVSASSGGVCVWGEAETPPLVGNQAAGAAGAVSSLGASKKTQDSTSPQHLERQA